MSDQNHVRQVAPFRWEGIPVLAYKEDGGTHFRAITRQVLFEGSPSLGAQLRYFEIAPGGHSTLERHDHIHSVMILRGDGQALVGDCIIPLSEHDLVAIPPQTWHQFRATSSNPLGFLCLVCAQRDKPRRPSPDELAGLLSNPAVADFIRA